MRKIMLLGFFLFSFVLGAYQAGLAKEVVLYSSNQVGTDRHGLPGIREKDRNQSLLGPDGNRRGHETGTGREG